MYDAGYLCFEFRIAATINSCRAQNKNIHSFTPFKTCNNFCKNIFYCTIIVSKYKLEQKKQKKTNIEERNRQVDII